MDEFVKLLDPALNYVGHRVEEQKCIIIVESNRKEVTCPYWGLSVGLSVGVRDQLIKVKLKILKRNEIKKCIANKPFY